MKRNEKKEDKNVNRVNPQRDLEVQKIDGWMEENTDMGHEWMKKWMDGWLSHWMERSMDGWIHETLDG